ncbi:cryptochrome/photolyase family protein [Sneathiella chinensis]|uniref:Deoxyribodipyrimidine photo-lyase n=1 Tax=Sneathiella chinensis TaxID=349750 RepID=A0ABQ5U3T5_9PROT|nr:deoxyribodipyrimidine photo-lyase [Sneathiella chinensis]GLQ05949.1 deoxyribodipyrimidine photo-lyase [Sneathiella chinensis]
MGKVSIHWFRQDLRLSDNPALSHAVKQGAVLPVYILDDEAAGDWKMGGASRVWLHHSLAALKESLGGHLAVFKGSAEHILTDLVAETGAETLTWTRCYEPWRRERDERIKSRFQDMGLDVLSGNGSLLWEPWTIRKGDGGPYRVFTPFYKKGCLAAPPPREPQPAPDISDFAPMPSSSLEVGALELLPTLPWGEEMMQHWTPGEKGADQALDRFFEVGLSDYSEGRDFPARPATSGLSPYLHFGEMSPNQAWCFSGRAGDFMGCEKDAEHFRRELAWREFSYSQLYFHPDLPTVNLNRKYDVFPWQEDTSLLRQWQKGETGIPLVDAGMRQLWQTGHMHNRVRMVVASFLVKNLLIDWRQGQAWFWDTLVDADLANNAAAWQWVAGSGADAAPYFRIFNPATQGERFDPDGDYIRQYVPELSSLPDKWLSKPWEAPEAVLRQAGVSLGKNYPHPIVDLKASRQRALTAYEQVKAHEVNV